MRRSVLFITREIVPFLYGGIGSQFKSMANLLISSGFEVGFITRKYGSFDDNIFKKHYPECFVHFVDEHVADNVADYSYSGGLISHFNLCYSRAVEKVLEKIYEDLRPTFIVSADFGAELFSCLMKKKAGFYQESEFVLFLEGSTHDALSTYESGVSGDFASELNDPQNILTCSLENICVYLADYVISPTQIMWEQTHERLKCNCDPLIIPNLTSRDFFDNTLLNNKSDSPLLLFVGRLDFHKGADLLLQSFIQKYSDCVDEDTPVLRFIGRDTFCKSYGMTFLEYWENRIPSHLGKYIEFMGQVVPQMVRDNLERATLCVFPSRWEVFGIVCLEAMACGCPVAVSSHTGLSEVVGEQFCDFKFDFENENKSLYELFETLLCMDAREYESLCQTFHARAKEVVEQGNNALLGFFNKNEDIRTDVTEAECVSFSELNNCINALGTIASTLSHDFNKLLVFNDLDSETLKTIVRTTGKTELEEAGQLCVSGNIKNNFIKRITKLFR